MGRGGGGGGWVVEDLEYMGSRGLVWISFCNLQESGGDWVRESVLDILFFFFFHLLLSRPEAESYTRFSGREHPIGDLCRGGRLLWREGITDGYGVEVGYDAILGVDCICD